jgi:hypothetical protein
MFSLLRGLWTESSPREKQNLTLALLGIVLLVGCALSWFVWHRGWLAVALLVLTGIVTKPLGDELDDLYR